MVVAVCTFWTLSAYAQNLEWRELASIGKYKSDEVNDMYGDVNDVFVRSSNDIYIADDLPLHIRRVDSTGVVKNIIGSRGMGPDQLSSIATFTVDDDGRVVVVDYRARMIKVFSTSGELESTHPMDGLGFPRRIVPLDDGNYLVLSGRNSRPVEASRMLFTETDESFRAIKRFGSTADMRIDTTGFVSNYMDYNPGYIDVLGNTLVYVPPIYEGKIFLFERIDSHWTGPRELERPFGHVPLVLYDPKDRPVSSIVIKSNVQDDFAAQILSRSLGVFFEGPDRISLFYRLALHKEDVSVPIKVEQYNLSGALLRSTMHQELNPPRLSSPQTAIEVAGFHDGRYYLLDIAEYPHLRVVEISRQYE